MVTHMTERRLRGRQTDGGIDRNWFDCRDSWVCCLVARDSFVVNAEYEGMSYKELADTSLSGWVHHVQYILPQVVYEYMHLLVDIHA